MEDLQTQELPKSDENKLRVAKSMQYDDWNTFYQDLEIHRGNVELYFDEVFKESIKDEDSPQLNITKVLWNSTLKLEDAHKHLESLSFKLPDEIYQVLEGLKHSSRYLHLPEASRQRFDLVMPLIILEASLASDSHLTLIRIISILESICRRASYLAMLTENPSALKILIKLAEAGPWLTQYLIQHPILIDELLDINHFYTKPDFTEIKKKLQKDLVIAYGKFGGKEMSYTSDLDIVFIYDDERDGMAEKYARFAQRINSWLNTYTSSGVLYQIDLALRPDGASGLLVSSIDAFRDYQLKRAWTWEHQAITRARFCAGDKSVADREHFDLKQDRGGIIDIEFIVQYFVLAFSASDKALSQNIGNIGLLDLLGEKDFIKPLTARKLIDAYRLYRRLQHQLGLEAKLDGNVNHSEVGVHPKVVRAIWSQIFT
ncbi:MAG: hypothetical protein EB109_03125 [Methylophilaceae bacterium]|nr:hypothetical protein [Methylophilaceae bacterium]